MAEVQNLSRLLMKLNSLANKYGASAKLVVGYKAPYATVVHERLDVYHVPPTKAKYLEEPARRMMSQTGKTVVTLIREGKTVEEALLQAGTNVLTESQKIVPVDTGVLKASGFVALERA